MNIHRSLMYIRGQLELPEKQNCHWTAKVDECDTPAAKNTIELRQSAVTHDQRKLLEAIVYLASTPRCIAHNFRGTRNVDNILYLVRGWYSICHLMWSKFILMKQKNKEQWDHTFNYIFWQYTKTRLYMFKRNWLWSYWTRLTTDHH